MNEKTTTPLGEAVRNSRFVLLAVTNELATRKPLKAANEQNVRALPEPQGQLNVEKVVFTPPGGQKPVLKWVSFALEAGESMAIVGPSAAGKSTLTRLIVLDEPNASLESEGEEDLLRAMDKLKNDGATVMLIAHRPSMVSQVDKILFLRGGVIEMFGPRDEVLPQLTRPVPVMQARTAS
jgi:ABC-type protease/lipase transport system fused ATPase/permease subunit